MRLTPLLLTASLLLAGCVATPETPQQNGSTPAEKGAETTEDGAGGADAGPMSEASVTVGNVGYDYSDALGEGTLRGVQVEVKNTGSVAFEPRFRVTVKVDGDEIYVNEDVEPRFGRVTAGESAGQRLEIQRTIRRRGRYRVTVAVTTTDGVVLDEASRTFSVV